MLPTPIWATVSTTNEVAIRPNLLAFVIHDRTALREASMAPDRELGLTNPDGRGHAIRNWHGKGTRDLASYKPGELVDSIDDITAGQILFDDNVQFGALNLCRVTKIDRERGICYATMVNPMNVQQGRLGGRPEPDFAIWAHEFSPSFRAKSFGNRWFKALASH